MIDETTKVVSITARPVLVPLRRVVQTAKFSIPQVPLVLIDIETSTGVTGRAYVMAFAEWVFSPLVGCIKAAESMIAGERLAPAAIQKLLREKFLLIGISSMTSVAVGGIDMALWDALAKERGLPLSGLLGGKPETLRAYNSCGLWLNPADTLADEALELIEEGGFSAVKIRLGRPDPVDDLKAVRQVRKSLGSERSLMSDYNQSLRTGDAIERGKMLDAEGLAWIEEPVAFDNYEGHARVRAALSTPIQTGENFYDARKMQRAFNLQAFDYVMPDAGLIGGVTGWQQAASLADVNDIPMSSHLYPEFSRHLLSVTPSAHWLEYVDWASPVLQEPVLVIDGNVVTPATPGAGVEWDETAVARYLV